jgi:hypothetical protein
MRHADNHRSAGAWQAYWQTRCRIARLKQNADPCFILLHLRNSLAGNRVFYPGTAFSCSFAGRGETILK